MATCRFFSRRLDMKKSLIFLMISSLWLTGCAQMIAATSGSEPVGKQEGERTLSQRIEDSSIENTANINLYLWNTGKNYNASKIVLPVFQYNVRHDGVYNKPSLVSTGNNGSFVTKGFELKQNYPNPFNPSTTINYSIPKPEFVKLCVYDLLGKEVASLVNEIKGAGSYEFNFNALNLSSGIYVYKISAGDFSASKQMILIK